MDFILLMLVREVCFDDSVNTLETTEPGPRWHIPWPVENVEVVNVSQIFTIEVGYRNSVKTKF